MVLKLGRDSSAARAAAYSFQKFPTIAVNEAGEKKVVHNPDEYERHTGIRVDHLGNPVDIEPQPPMPPSLEVVMKAGYEKAAAIDIVAEEWRKCSEGEPPYEWNAAPLSRSGQADAKESAAVEAPQLALEAQAEGEGW